MIPKTPPAYEITIKVPTLSDVLDQEQKKSQRMNNIRTKYGKPNPKDKKLPSMQMEGDNEG